MGRGGGRGGFTLIELLIVVGILSLLLSLSFPSFSNFREGIYLEASAREMASAARKTQALAMCRGETLAVGRFKFSKTGFPPPGGSGTETLAGRNGQIRKVIVSSAGRVRLE